MVNSIQIKFNNEKRTQGTHYSCRLHLYSFFSSSSFFRSPCIFIIATHVNLRELNKTTAHSVVHLICLCRDLLCAVSLFLHVWLAPCLYHVDSLMQVNQVTQRSYLRHLFLSLLCSRFSPAPPLFFEFHCSIRRTIVCLSEPFHRRNHSTRSLDKLSYIRSNDAAFT